MEKPFDVKDLEAKLKEKGLPLLENGAKDLVEVLFTWVDESVKVSDSKVDDLIVAVLPSIKSFLLSKVEKISA